MRALRLILLAGLILLSSACASVMGGRGAERVTSVSGTVNHGEFITVPWGTVDDWSIIVAPHQMGVEEPGSEEDNRLLRFRVFATVQDPTNWQVTAQYRFAYARDNANVHWVGGSAHYLIVRK